MEGREALLWVTSLRRYLPLQNGALFYAQMSVSNRYDWFPLPRFTFASRERLARRKGGVLRTPSCARSTGAPTFAPKFAILICCRVSMCRRIPSLHCVFLSMCTLFHVTCDHAGFVVRIIDVFHFAVACRIEFAYVCPQLWLELSLPLSLSLCASAWCALLLLLLALTQLLCSLNSKPVGRR